MGDIKYKSADDIPNNTGNQGGFINYWQLIGKIVSLFCVPLALFTVLLGLKLDRYINWSYWIIFSPIIALLLISLLLTSYQKLSGPAPPTIRFAFLLWIVCLASFFVLLMEKIEHNVPLSTVQIFAPLYVIAGILFLAGFYVTFIMGCWLKDVQDQQRYILSGIPLFAFSLIFLPFILLLSFKEGVDNINVSWAVVFIPLFVADGFCFCLGFFLLLFSFGSRKDALFSITQLFLFLAIIPISIAFKVLLILKLNGTLNIPALAVLSPLFALELLFMLCGANIAIATPKDPEYVAVRTVA